jgi:hypothetical protein
MIRIPVVATFLVYLFLTGCTKQRDVLFEIPFRLNFEIPAGLNPFDKHFFSIRNVPTNLSTLRDKFDISEDQTLMIRPATAVFSSVLQNIALDFIEEIGISVYEGIETDNDTDVFLTDIVPQNAGRNINILGFDYDVAEQMNMSKVNFLVAIRLRATTPVFIDGNIDLKFTAE